MENVIIYILAFCYYTFCVIAGTTYIQAPKKYKFLEGLGLVLLVMIMSPISVPIGLGIIVGEKAKNLYIESTEDFKDFENYMKEE